MCHIYFSFVVFLFPVWRVLFVLCFRAYLVRLYLTCFALCFTLVHLRLYCMVLCVSQSATTELASLQYK